MSLTTERTTITVRPYTVDDLGRVYCGGCRAPGEASSHVPDPRGGFYDPGPDGWRQPTDAEYRAGLEDIGECARCHAHPADFPQFDTDATVLVEHTPCRIF